MNIVEPQVFIVGRTVANLDGMTEYLEAIGDPDWSPDPLLHDGDLMTEFMGRLCYRSWEPYNEAKPDATNPNVSKVRQGNQQYISNILESKHGSVTEHTTFNFVFASVSRVFTHELVRHRAGMAYSQESMRYVRLDHINVWIPELIRENHEALQLFEDTIQHLEYVQNELARIFDIANIRSFERKKALTSAFRRLAPIGVATHIGASGNVRAIRHEIEMRTSEHAEEEIRLVFGIVAEMMQQEAPNLFQDMSNDGNGIYTFTNKKI